MKFLSKIIKLLTLVFSPDDTDEDWSGGYGITVYDWEMACKSHCRKDPHDYCSVSYDWKSHCR